MKRTWLRADVVDAIHEAQIAEHGGKAGIRDRGLLESALARPQNLDAYATAKPDIPTLAAAYAIGIIRDHPFFDGNKRVGFVTLELFLDLNGYDFAADDVECVTEILSLAAGQTSDEAFTAWVRSRSRRRRATR